ncbi:hypothetical protein EJB05_41591, partial [Eragrostis curvula]
MRLRDSLSGSVVLGSEFFVRNCDEDVAPRSPSAPCLRRGRFPAVATPTQAQVKSEAADGREAGESKGRGQAKADREEEKWSAFSLGERAQPVDASRDKLAFLSPPPHLAADVLVDSTIIGPALSEVKAMGSEAFDLNEQPNKNRGASWTYVLLQKDSKNICRTKVCDLPIEVPFIWPIVSFVPTKAYERRDFPKLSLLPYPEDRKQKAEWGKFMQFLSDNKKAAIVRCGSSTFHILAPQPDESPDFSHAVLMFECGQNGPEDCKQTPGLSAREEHMNSPAMNVSKRSSKYDLYGSRNPKLPYFKEEIGDSRPNPKGMATSHKHHNPLDMELCRSVPESSPCESVEDSPRVLNPTVKKQKTSPTKNFISADPSYLRTLSQTHAGWIFGAIAELIDNSRDAGASRLSISIESLFSKKAQRKIPVLSVIDDGCGMTYADMMRMISFGHKRPNEHCEDQIGRFGIGFKTGAMKLGKDAVVLTQTSSSRSVAFLSQSFNQEKDNLEIPVVAYCKEGHYMEVDLSVQSEATAEYNLNAIKEFSSFNEYFIGEKLGLFGENGTGTQIYIWNLDKWGTDYTLEWNSGKLSENPVHNGRGDILIHSRRVPLDYSLQSYLELMFLNPRMKITVQGSSVKSRPLAKTLNNTSVVSGEIMGRSIVLTLGRSKVEWDRMNCGIFLYWHGRLIESYKRVGGQKHSADVGRGLIGVADITNLIDDEDGNSWVLNNKQGFQDCEMYAKLEEWLGRKVDEYWDTKYDNLELFAFFIQRKAGERYKPDQDWVQCYSCRKWRMLNAGFNSDTLPEEWFCNMPPFNGKCEVPEQQMGRGVIVIGEKRGYDEQKKGASPVHKNSEDDLDSASSQTEDNVPRPHLKRLRRGPAKGFLLSNFELLRLRKFPVKRRAVWSNPKRIQSVTVINRSWSREAANAALPFFDRLTPLPTHPPPSYGHRKPAFLTRLASASCACLKAASLFGMYLKAAIVKFGSSTFHILAPQPDEHTNFSHAVLMYDHETNDPGSCRQMLGTSVKQVHSPVANVSKRTHKSEFQYRSTNQKPYFNEEICESGMSKEMNSSHKHHELHRTVAEFSPIELVEDGPKACDPVRKRATAPRENFIHADPSYLRTLGHTHGGWIFGALAELIDNSRDGGSSRLNISIEFLFLKKQDTFVPVLSVIDDGHGMTYADMMRMVSFGHKGSKEHCKDQIGRFGIGFKTGAMKLGKDAVVLTQTPSSRSVAFLSQSFNEKKDNVEIPVVTYRREGQYMEVDLSIQSEATAKYNLNAIKEFSPFNEYSLGEKLGLFHEEGTGTQVYIWNLDKWGTEYTLEWHSRKSLESIHTDSGDILIRSRRVRSRPGQTSNKVPLDYSLQSYLEVMFLNPRMKISVQGSWVKSRPLAKTLNKTSVVSGEVMGRTVLLTLGMSKDEENGHSWVLNNKQGFEDCEIYAKLEEWLGCKVDEYWDTNFDTLELRKGGGHYKADDQWVQCYSCRKWRVLSAGFNTESLPDEWFCYMPPFSGKCEIPEQQLGHGVIVVGEKRTAYQERNRVAAQKEEMAKKPQRSENIEVESTTQDEVHVKIIQDIPATINKGKNSSNGSPSMHKNDSDDDPECASLRIEDNTSRPTLKRLRRGPASSYKVEAE